MPENPRFTEGELKLTPIVYLILRKGIDDTLFLKRRSGNFSLPAGHIEYGETVFTAGIREAREELGIQINRLDMELKHVGHFKDPDGHRIGFFIEVKRWEGQPQNMEPDKHRGIFWFPDSNLPFDTPTIGIVTVVRRALASIAEGQFFSEHGFATRQ